MDAKQTKSKPIFRYVVLALLAGVLGLNLYSLNARRLAGNQVPMPFGVGLSVVLSGSMEPALSVGDLLIVREAADYAAGEIVVFQSGGIAVVHRIVALEDDSVITKGDANNSPDRPIPVEAIKGKVALAIPVVGYVVWAMKSPAGVLVTMGAAILLMELSYRGTKKEKELEQEQVRAEIRQLLQELKED